MPENEKMFFLFFCTAAGRAMLVHFMLAICVLVQADEVCIFMNKTVCKAFLFFRAI
jgi:hypothetical protein